MRKLLLTLAFLCMTIPAWAGVVTVDAFLSADDVTIAHLEQFRTRVVDAINNADGGNLQNGSITHTKLDANTDPVNRWSESFNNYVYTGLLPSTGTVGSSPISAGTAYVAGYRVVKDAVSPSAIEYPANKYIYVDLKSNGSYNYDAQAKTNAEPSTPSTSVRLARVETTGTNIVSVRDDRPIGISLNQEDFFIKGMNLIYVTPDVTTITIDTGIASYGGVRKGKTVLSNLDISKNTDYITASSERGVSKWLYVYMNSNGSFKLGATAPNYHDTTGTTTGFKYYYYDGSAYYRYIGQVRLDASGSGNIIPFYQQDDYYNYGKYGNQIIVNNAAPTNATWTDCDCSSLIPPNSVYGDFFLAVINGANGGVDAVGGLRTNGELAPKVTIMNSSYTNIGSGAVIGSSQDVAGGGSMNWCGSAGKATCITDASQVIEYVVIGTSGSSDKASIYVSGYWVNNR